MLYIAIILFALVTIGVAVVAFENIDNTVTLAVLFGQSLSLSVGLLLLLVFLLGALLLYLIGVGAAERDRQELRRLRERVVELEQATLRVPSGQLPVVQSVPPTVPIVPMPGMPGPDISDMPTQH